MIGRFAAKFQKFGSISNWLPVRFLGWAFGFLWPFFEGRLAENFFCWPFLIICLYFKAKLSTTSRFLKSYPLCMRFVLCSEL